MQEGRIKINKPINLIDNTLRNSTEIQPYIKGNDTMKELKTAKRARNRQPSFNKGKA